MVQEEEIIWQLLVWAFATVTDPDPSKPRNLINKLLWRRPAIAAAESHGAQGEEREYGIPKNLPTWQRI